MAIIQVLVVVLVAVGLLTLVGDPTRSKRQAKVKAKS